MKTIGLIGGISLESSLEYYRIINETVKAKLGGFHSAKCLMYSVDFAEIETLQQQDRWDDAAQLMIDAAQRLERGGADFIVICTNTMHKSVDAMQSKIHIPLLHIADATAQKVKAAGIRRIGLLGTRFTMEHDFYTGRLVDRFGLDVIVPNREERELIHRVIYDELCLGIIKPQSREEYIRIINNLVKQGAEGIILGCTEIESLVRAEDSHVPLPHRQDSRDHCCRVCADVKGSRYYDYRKRFDRRIRAQREHRQDAGERFDARGQFASTTVSW